MDNAKMPREICCVVCETDKGEGIQLYTSFLCVDCERKIIQTSPSDPDYKYFLSRLKKIRTELLS